MAGFTDYLIALGFKINEDERKKFDDATSRARKNVTALGDEAVATSIAVAAAVSKIARQYEELYYVSQRTGSSVAGLRTHEFAMRQIGVAADASRAQIESFGQAIRLNPGLAGLLKSMGIDSSNAQTASIKFAENLKKRFGEGGYFAAAKFSELFGVDEQTFRQLWTNLDKMKAAEADHKRRLKESGVDTEKLAKDSRDFNNTLQSLLTSMGLVADQTASKWLPTMTEGVSILDKLAQGIVKIGKDTDGWTSSVLSLVTAFGSLKVAGWVLRLLGLGGLAVGASGLGTVAGVAAVGIGGYAAAKTMGPIDWGAVSKSGSNKFGASGGMSQNAQGAVDFYKKMGWSDSAAFGLAANEFRESRHDPNAKGDGGLARGAYQWHPDRQAVFRRLFGKDIGDATLDEQRQFKHYELTKGQEARAGDRLRGASNAAEAGAIVSKYDLRPKNVDAEARLRGGLAQQWFDASLAPTQSAGGVTVNQKTEVTVAPGPTANETAAAVGRVQGRVNGDMVRNFEGAVR